jgi:hypothetical protein
MRGIAAPAACIWNYPSGRYNPARELGPKITPAFPRAERRRDPRAGATQETHEHQETFEMAELIVLNPVARVDRPKIPSAARPADLSGKTIGLFWNGKSGGETLLDQSAVLLKQRYSGLKFRHYDPSTLKTAQQYDAMARECDAVIQATGD